MTQIPEAFLERYLWPVPSPAAAATPAADADVEKDSKNDADDKKRKEKKQLKLPKFKFSKGISTELNSLVALAFSKAEKRRSESSSASIPTSTSSTDATSTSTDSKSTDSKSSDSKSSDSTPAADDTTDAAMAQDKCVVLSCTHAEGTYIIDAAVRRVAAKQNADVLVLDALEVASGRFGLLGAAGEAIDEVYASVVQGSRVKDKKDEEEDDEKKKDEEKKDDEDKDEKKEDESKEKTDEGESKPESSPKADEEEAAPAKVDEKEDSAPEDKVEAEVESASERVGEEPTPESKAVEGEAPVESKVDEKEVEAESKVDEEEAEPESKEESVAEPKEESSPEAKAGKEDEAESTPTPTEAEASKADDKPSASERARKLIDALLSSTLPPANGEEPTAAAPERRIIYMRDFQAISAVAKPLMTYILQSIHDSHVATSTSPPSKASDTDDTAGPAAAAPSAPLKRTFLLVFGSTKSAEPLTIDNAPTSSQKNALYLNCLFTTTRAALSNRVTTGCTCSSCQPWQSSSPKVDLDPVPFDEAWGKRVDALAGDRLGMALFAANVKSGVTDAAWQKAVKGERVRRVNGVVLRGYLEEEKCPLQGDAEGDVAVFGKNNSELIEIDDALTIITIAMGLIADASVSKQEVKLSKHVSTAYKIFQRRKKERKDWESGETVGKDDDDADASDDEKDEAKEKEEEDDDDESDSDSDADSDEEEQKPKEKKPKETYDDVSSHAKELLGCIIDTDEIETKFSDVFVDESIMDSLQTIVTLPLLFPNYFNSGVLAKEAIGGVLLYGPPGTGKTMLCRALAKNSHARMLHIKPSDINDKYVGESEKRVTAVFELAHRMAPCIVFIDEIDSLFSSRTDQTRTWERNILTEFMQGMDGLRSAKKNRENNIIIVGATNRPFDLDLAVLRRMPRRILVDMPNLDMRKGILGSYLKDEKLEGVDVDQLAKETEGFSGSDLKNLCVAAALASVKEAIGPEWKTREKPPAKEKKKSKKEKKPAAAAAAAAEADDKNDEKDAAGGDSTKTEGPEKKKKKKDEEEPPARVITPANIRQARSDITKSVVGGARGGDELYKWHQRYSTGPAPVATPAGPAPPPPAGVNGVNGVNGAHLNGSLTSQYTKPAATTTTTTNGHWNRWSKPATSTVVEDKPRD